ncbi:hypothetical protein WIT60_03840 [Aquabacterium sp. G14]|jgi:hypothetical protein|uniref:hypothetical protein n=1 Tax=Aquabacterium sp. G14 TaxID=3130164 RepID=UPI003097C891
MFINAQLWETQLDMMGNTMILFMVYLLAEAALPRLPWLASRARRKYVRLSSIRCWLHSM